MKCPIIITPSNTVEKAGDSFSRMIRSASGRSKLAQAMTNPIRKGLDYSGIARRCFVVDQLPAGALPSYDKDPDVSSVIKDNYKFSVVRITSNNSVIKKENGVFGRKVIFPRFEIYKSPTIILSDIKTRGFSIIDRCK